MAERRPARRSSPSDWSYGLPQELLEWIGGRLQSGSDAGAFRSVCSRWRAALPFARFAPVLLLPFGPPDDSPVVTFYSVAGGEGVFSRDLPEVRGRALCGSSRGWLALVDGAAAVTLLNPFTGARAELPPADERVATASSRSVSMVDGRWVLRPDGGGHGHGAVAMPVNLADMRDVFFREIVLSSPPYSGAAGRKCVAMAVLANSTEVAFCRLGDDSAWMLLDTNLECCVNSIVHVHGSRFVATGCLGEISICDITAGATPTTTPMPSLAPPAQLCHRSYLQVNGELHLVGAVVRASHKAWRFTYRTAVYKCDLVAGMPAEWSRVKDAGDVTLFVSKHFKASFGGASISARLKRNSVYFSEPLYGHEEDPDHRLEIANIATGSTSELQAYHHKLHGLEAICWIKPNLWTESRVPMRHGPRSRDPGAAKVPCNTAGFGARKGQTDYLYGERSQKKHLPMCDMAGDQDELLNFIDAKIESFFSSKNQQFLLFVGMT